MEGFVPPTIVLRDFWLKLVHTLRGQFYKLQGDKEIHVWDDGPWDLEGGTSFTASIMEQCNGTTAHLRGCSSVQLYELSLCIYGVYEWGCLHFGLMIR